MGTSHQKGWVSVRGKKWYGYFRRTVLNPETNEPKIVSTPIALGLKARMSKFEAREKLVEEITRLTGQSAGDDSIRNGAVTFGWFVHNRFFPLKEARWKEETAKVKKLLIQQDLIDEFEDVPLENFDKFTLQMHINKLAKTRCKDTVLQMRAYLRDIFAEAVDQGFLAKDPARKVKTPTQLRPTDKTTLTWDQLRDVLAKLEIRDRILLELDMANALRPGELFGVRWNGFDAAACSITLTETTYKGKIRLWGKTRGSLTTIPIAKELARDLVEWKQQCPNPSPEAFIFAAPQGGFMDSSNYRKRVLHKLAEELGLPKLTFQVIRRTIATLAQKKGTVKDVQGILRHARPGTTTDVYMQEIPESVRATVNSIHTELKSGKGKRRAASEGARTEGSKPAKRNLNPGLVVTTTTTATEPMVASEPKGPRSSRGKVLEFATRMRQNCGKEVALNG
jgi:integrase